MNNSHLLKQFTTQLSKAQSELAAKQQEIAGKKREIVAKEKLIKELKVKISNLKDDKNVIVSEHAILRYFERVLGFDLAEIQSKILTDSVQDLIGKLGSNSGQYPVKEGGFSVVLKEKTIVTII